MTDLEYLKSIGFDYVPGGNSASYIRKTIESLKTEIEKIREELENLRMLK